MTLSPPAKTNRPLARLAAPAAALAMTGLLAAAPAHAAISGVLDIDSTGTANVSASTITFTGNFLTTPATTLSYSGGTVGSGVTGTVAALTAPPPVSNFLMFTTIPSLSFTLTTISPLPCSGTAFGSFCLIPTATGTAAVLNVMGTDKDASGVAGTFSGLFTANLAAETPAQIMGTINGGGTITSSYSAQFVASVASVPEPSAAALVGAALLGFGLVVRRRMRG